MSSKKFALSVDNQVVGTLIISGSAMILLSPQQVMAQATVPKEVQDGIDTSIATVKALNPLSQSALSVALLPLGAFLTLAFIQKVMSRV